ncbi:MAG: hypothetical protein ACLPID_20585 [Beijerinckiaceae bacterium]
MKRDVVPAQPGFFIRVYDQRILSQPSGAKEYLIQQTDHPVIAWEIVENFRIPIACISLDGSGNLRAALKCPDISFYTLEPTKLGDGRERLRVGNPISEDRARQLVENELAALKKFHEERDAKKAGS